MERARPEDLTVSALGLMLVCVLPVLLGMARTGCSQARRVEPVPPATTSGGATFRVVSYNIDWHQPGDAATVETIRGCGADLVFLQETSPAWERVLRGALGKLYPHMAFRNRKRGAGGQAVLSRFPVQPREYVDSPVDWWPAWRLVVASPLGQLQVLQVHLRPWFSDREGFLAGFFGTGAARRAEIIAHTRVLHPDMPTLVVGDFNEDRQGPAVSWLERQGWRNALGRFGDLPTWRYPTRWGELRHTLDHILHNEYLVPLRVRVIRSGNSDHYPIMAEFQRAYGS